VPADRRSAILDAAIDVIARRGVRGFRVERVAEQAGVAVSLLYYYFGSRNGLVRATLDHANERAATTVRRASGRASVEATLLAELDEAARDTSFVWGEVLASAATGCATRPARGPASWPRRSRRGWPTGRSRRASTRTRRPTG
jgi:AcrR family transcriptional regulator